MDEVGSYTKQEILSQPESWSSALPVLAAQKNDLKALLREGFSQVLFTGCGSTYYLSLAASALLTELTGLASRALPASELWLYPRCSYPSIGKTLLVAVSRSGETSETIHACEDFLSSRSGEVLTLTCYPESALARLGRLNIALPSGAERSVAQTRAFSTLYLATIALAALASDRDELFAGLDKLPPAAQHLLDNYAWLAKEIGADLNVDRFYFLGSGPRYGLACELSLKMKEMTLSHSEPFHFLEFRHGPKSMITNSALVVGLVSQSDQGPEAKVVEEMLSMGARSLTIGEQDVQVPFQSGLEEAARNVLYLPVGQLVAFERSIAKGLNPDRPHNLDSVVKL